MSESPTAARNLPKFPLGNVVATANATKSLSHRDMLFALGRHASGDWGKVCEEDRQTNDEALNFEGRLLSAYLSGNGVKFWIITESDRSVTTILLPEDY